MNTKFKNGKKVDPSNPDTIPKFVDELSIPLVARPRGVVKGSPYYEIAMKQIQHQYHSSFPSDNGLGIRWIAAWSDNKGPEK